MININRDTIATFLIADHHADRDTIDDALAIMPLDEFLDIAMTELRDADDIHDLLNPLDNESTADAILDTITNDYDFIRTELKLYILRR